MKNIKAPGRVLLSYETKCIVRTATCITWTEKLCLIIFCYIREQYQKVFDMKVGPQILMIPTFYVMYNEHL